METTPFQQQVAFQPQRRTELKTRTRRRMTKRRTQILIQRQRLLGLGQRRRLLLQGPLPLRAPVLIFLSLFPAFLAPEVLLVAPLAPEVLLVVPLAPEVLLVVPGVAPEVLLGVFHPLHPLPRLRPRLLGPRHPRHPVHPLLGVGTRMWILTLVVGPLLGFLACFLACRLFLSKGLINAT